MRVVVCARRVKGRGRAWGWGGFVEALCLGCACCWRRASLPFLPVQSAGKSKASLWCERGCGLSFVKAEATWTSNETRREAGRSAGVAGRLSSCHHYDPKAPYAVLAHLA